MYPVCPVVLLRETVMTNLNQQRMNRKIREITAKVSKE